MATALRCLTIIALIVLLALFVTPTLHAAPPQSSAADLTLFNAANHDRAAALCDFALHRIVSLLF